MTNTVCKGCNRSVVPLERLEKDKKDKKKAWLITYCPFDRCRFNIDIEPANVKIWNSTSSYFEDGL